MSRLLSLHSAAIAIAMLQSIDRMEGKSSGYVRNVEVEPAKPGKPREDFPSRQTYRAYLRELAKHK
ncbi:hypothetical protein [Alkanindiges illinoisensis]|uniref:hypothetical protein n=1 Tax=Alkanindiges illinoisensis TaxID=197183 RepID=UPI00047B5CE9|nr:hypothetical protein [Alkanindiges illinoisensis]